MGQESAAPGSLLETVLLGCEGDLTATSVTLQMASVESVVPAG